MSWTFSDKPDSALTIRVLRLAINKRRPTGHVVFHSDSNNAVTERFFRSLKAERVNYHRYETRSQGIADVIDNIDGFYNLKRRHYRLGNISPNEYVRRLQQCA
ncbi:TPA: IS3 family transposase [Citrobacter freundii]|nr:IS3 family transposase [Citrobacter freundii]